MVSLSAADLPRSALSRALFLCLGLGVVLFPIFLTPIPPLADYPNHLARVFILKNLSSIPVLAEYYRSVLGAQPNLAFDIIVGTLSQIMPLQTAGRVFVALTIISMMSGVLLLHRAVHQRLSLWPLLALLFVYNRLFLWGFLGYLFTLGCALGAFAAWVLLRDKPALRLTCATVFATLIYLGHLYAFGIYALCILGYELSVFWRGRSWRSFRDMAAAGLQFVPGTCVFLFVSPTSGAVGATYWGPFWRKIEAVAGVIFNYNLAFDIGCLAVVGAVAVGGLLMKRAEFKTFMLWPLALLVVAFLAMPDRLFSSYGADKRLPIAIALIAISSIDWVNRRSLRVVMAGFAVILLARMAMTVDVWAQSGKVYAEAERAIRVLPEGKKLLVAIAHPNERSLPPIPLFEIANLAIIERSAFVPSLFTFPNDAAQTVARTEAMEKLAKATPHHIVLPHTLKRLEDATFAATHGPFRKELIAQYDYAFIVDRKTFPIPPPKGELVFTGQRVTLIRLKGP